MTPRQTIAFVRRNGVVLASARGPVPNLADAVAGAPIEGNWWTHARGREIFRALQAARESADVLVCRLIDAKITLVHRRLWPALVRCADRFPASALAQVHEEHTAQGRHVKHETAFPDWVPREVIESARALDETAALRSLGAWTERYDGTTAARTLKPGGLRRNRAAR